MPPCEWEKCQWRKQSFYNQDLLRAHHERWNDNLRMAYKKSLFVLGGTAYHIPCFLFYIFCDFWMIQKLHSFIWQHWKSATQMFMPWWFTFTRNDRISLFGDFVTAFFFNLVNFILTPLFNTFNFKQDLLAWLNEQKKAGYTIVGIEQTSSSQSLSELKFPKKTVLLLGKEKEGIPVQFLQVVDVCVEIPQLGLIRSLNVHVSGAISIWEYTKQMMAT